MNGFRAYGEGLSRAAGYWRLVILMVIVGLLSALVAAAPAAVALLQPARRPAIRGVIDGVDGWMVIEALSAPPIEEGSSAFAQGTGQIDSPALLAIGTLLVVIVALLWLAAWELTRVAVVVGERRNVFRAFGRAVGFVFHRSLSVALLYALSLVSWAALYLLYRWALVPRLPRAWWLLTFFLQQVFVALWLWIRLGRWAGDVVLYQGESLAPEPGI
jgi:hypothetical protein